MTLRPWIETFSLRSTVWLVLAALLLLTPRPQGCQRPLPLRVATFNIRNYPESQQQEEGAFLLLRQLQVSAAAVQEIRDPAAFAAAASRHLGPRWRFVFPDRGPEQRVGVLFDSARLLLDGTWTYQDTVVYPGAKPAFAARLTPRDGGQAVLLMVVHLKAGGDGVALRRRQLEGLRRALARAAREGAPGARPVLLGDFNATGQEDRQGLAALAGGAGLTWATQGLACSAYWEPVAGERCQGSALDHMLVGGTPLRVQARGPCETEGCGARQSCPIFHRQVSDHCPVVTDL